LVSHRLLASDGCNVHFHLRLHCPCSKKGEKQAERNKPNLNGVTLLITDPYLKLPNCELS
jgi:hypothetical protein